MKLQLRGRTVHFEKPLVMGILNVTPDSFSDGGLYLDPDLALRRVDEMVRQGADIIDVGGESTRPGSEPVDEESELARVVPVISQIHQAFPELIVSVDTTKYEVARRALDAGAQIVNDVSGLRKEPRLAELCAQYGAGYVLMHSIKDPKTMQLDPHYDDVIEEISQTFNEGLLKLSQAGVKSVILDPGIGFGKTVNHNLDIIRNLGQFKRFGKPLLVGASRKRMIGEILGGRPAEGRLAGTLAVHYHALLQGASILRVHDVEEAADQVALYSALVK